MEAKDTVMKLEEVAPKFPDYIPCAVWDVLERQAEISFKAGQESRCDWHKPLPEIIAESFSEGKEQVVEWVNKNLRPYFVAFTEREWQAQLKEWGISSK